MDLWMLLVLLSWLLKFANDFSLYIILSGVCVVVLLEFLTFIASDLRKRTHIIHKGSLQGKIHNNESYCLYCLAGFSYVRSFRETNSMSRNRVWTSCSTIPWATAWMTTWCTFLNLIRTNYSKKQSVRNPLCCFIDMLTQAVLCHWNSFKHESNNRYCSLQKSFHCCVGWLFIFHVVVSKTCWPSPM